MTYIKKKNNSQSIAKNYLQYSSNERTKSQDFITTKIKSTVSLNSRIKIIKPLFLFIYGSKKDRDVLAIFILWPHEKFIDFLTDYSYHYLDRKSVNFTPN